MDIPALKEALEASPDNVPLLVLLARAEEAQFDLEDAAGHYQQALGFDPSNVDAAVGIARVLDYLGETSQSILRMEALCEKQPELASAWLLRATLALKEGQAKEARAYYERATELDNGLADDALLERIVKAGGTSAGPRRAALTPGGIVEEDWDADDDDGSFEGGDAALAHELELEFKSKVTIAFDDVGEMEEVKENIRMKIIYPLQKPELFKAYGKQAGGGVLLYGPPGCGKTMLSRATAGEIESNFFSVGLHQILDMYVGQSEQKLHQIFELVRSQAPAVLFFDEIDALAADRKDLKGSAARTVINQFLAELDGADASNEGMLVIGATNAPWQLDGAFLRPGRFDRLVFVPPPDEPARAEIARLMAREKPVIDFDPDHLAKKTAGFSGADISAVFDRATEATLPEAMKRGEVVPITGKDLAKQAKSVKPSTKKWFESAKNYALYANQSGFYDEVLDYMGIRK